jgi:hypothetical protein
MPIRFIVAGLALSACACASVPVPATRLPGSPAHPEAAEAITPAAAATLTNEAESNTHEGHVMSTPNAPASQASPAVVYTCPMHPQIEAQKPGTCPICGMTLVPKSKPKPDGDVQR